jgi:hypothetical protein
MRFSAVFHMPLVPLASRPALQRPAPVRVGEPAAPVMPALQAPPPAELPEDLDQRVRMVGEWQLGEG